MKKVCVISVILCLLLSVEMIGSGSIYGPTAIPFPYDPNKIIIGIISVDPDVLGPKLLGGINVRAGQEIVVDIGCYDRDDDAYSIRVLNWQSGMNLTVSNDPNNPTQLKWTPTNEQVGLHYINIEAWDFPPDPNDSLTDKGTLVFNVRPRNRPPILLPCGG